MNQPPVWVQKRVLLGPAPVRRAAQRGLGAKERWILRQPRSVRRSYVREVLERGATTELEEAWMLRQPDAVRESYVREVLGV